MKLWYSPLSIKPSNYSIGFPSSPFSYNTLPPKTVTISVNMDEYVLQETRLVKCSIPEKYHWNFHYKYTGCTQKRDLKMWRNCDQVLPLSKVIRLLKDPLNLIIALVTQSHGYS